jgi:hypothetical protein
MMDAREPTVCRFDDDGPMPSVLAPAPDEACSAITSA